MALNPYLGWLHNSEEDYESLVYDLMEPFRPFVDRVVLRLINRQELRAADFDDLNDLLGRSWKDNDIWLILFDGEAVALVN